MDNHDQIAKLMKNRLTIGFLDDNDLDESQSLIAEGIFEAAQKFDVNVIRFGHLLNGSKEVDFGIDKLLDCIEQIDIDGLIFLGWSRAVSADNLAKFKARFAKLPLLSLGKEIEDIPYVFFRKEQYFKEVLLHLIKVHHYQKIALIKPMGQDQQTDFYQELLTEYGIYHPELVVNAEEIECEPLIRGKKALEILLDERKVQFEAIVSFYTEETVAVLEELQLRGFNVPQDIAVACFEESLLGKFSSPPLTTVYYPFKELGYITCKMMLQLIGQQKCPMVTEIAGRVIIRESCGCSSQSVFLPKADQLIAASKGLMELDEVVWDQIATQIAREVSNTGLNLSGLLRTIRVGLINKDQYSVIKWLAAELGTFSDYRKLTALKDLPAIIRSRLLPYLKSEDCEVVIWCEDLLQQIQILIREKMINAWGRQQLYLNKINRNLQLIGHQLLSDFSIQNVVDTLEAKLKQLDIISCSIYLFKEPEMETNPFDSCELIFHYHENQKLEPRIYQHDDPHQLIAKTLFPHNRPYTIISNLLLVADQLIGFIIFEPKQIHPRIYQELSIHISTVLCGTSLIAKLDNSYKKLLEQAHRQGMADIISGTLHNICNVLNSINISIHMMKEYSKSSHFASYYKATALLKDNLEQLDWFIETDPKGEKLLEFLIKLNDAFGDLQDQMLVATNRIEERLGSIEDILTTHQSFTVNKPNLEEIDLCSIIEKALVVNLASLEKYKIKIIKDYSEPITAMIHSTKLFHVLLNLIKNAKEAMLDSDEDNRILTISVYQNDNQKYIRISDTGYGIPPDKLEMIFTHGFTTKEDGHGFGLHSCANYMTEMNGRIWAESDGVGKGASFVLEFP
ncbi:MAG TPA: ATP-binding protein [Bacillota bacterium]|jgi:signal transduction histidine kinase/DNA-binding LacI/PurR family transcriptional regulator|nr:ATP-binding protein [Bacillota bacterium]HOL10054.1 ATP-binding protein [Bacillota bacterium]HPO98534.1 ATP-binding protein [Bacillota bacterium]